MKTKTKAAVKTTRASMRKMMALAGIVGIGLAVLANRLLSIPLH